MPGVAATVISLLVTVVALTHTDNGRVFQEGVLVELGATYLFVRAGWKGSRWWFSGPMFVILFWVVAAHIPALWR